MKWDLELEEEIIKEKFDNFKVFGFKWWCVWVYGIINIALKIIFFRSIIEIGMSLEIGEYSMERDFERFFWLKLLKC